MQLILFDDHSWDNNLPLTFTRPVSDLRVGILSIGEKWERQTGLAVSCLTRDYLSKRYPMLTTDDNLFVNSALLPDPGLIGALTVFANNVWVYFASVFIIATVITETAFLHNLAAIIRGIKHNFDYKIASGEMATPQEIQNTQRHPMEYKILNTLWTKQVNKFPDFSKVFTFAMSSNTP